MKKWIYFGVMLIVAVLAVIILSPFIKEKVDHPKSIMAEDGIIDLRNTQIDSEPVELDGTWEFIPDRIIHSSEFDVVEATLVKVPGLWNNYEVNGQKVEKYTSGTYRLKILVDDLDKVYGIKTSNIRMSNAVYVNGKRIGGSGNPKEDKSYTPHNTPFTAYFSTDQKEIELLIHVANFDYASGGGIVSSIYFGDQKSIMQIHTSSLVYDWVTIAAFLTMFIYFIGTYLHFRKDIETLYFSLFCISMVLYSASHGEKILLTLSPYMIYEIFERIQMFSSVSIGFFLILYFYYGFKKYSNERLVSFLRVGGLILLSTAVFPPIINSHLQVVYSAYLFMVITYIIVVQVNAVWKREVGTIYLILSSFAIFIYYVVGTLNLVGNFQLTILPPILPFICLLMMSLYISNRFTDSFLKKEELSNALMRINKLKDEFLAKTSHEFQTPLHGITAISQSLLEQGDKRLTSAEKEKVSLIANITERLSHLVNDILDHSKIQQGELKLNITPVDLYSTTHVVTEIFNYINGKNVKIHNQVVRGQFVLADENRLRQILYNLIDNAVKYTAEGSIKIRSKIRQDIVIIEVIDTGIGISSENIELLYEPYQQFDTSVGGTGLGLSVVKQLVELQGGKVSVTSRIGKGSTFSFSLPVIDSQPDYQQMEHTMYHPKNQPIHLSTPLYIEKRDTKKVLIADDNHVNLKVLIDTLETESYSIIAVDNGQAVIDEVANNPDIDLIILDIMMPGLSGYEVSQSLRKKYNLSELPILMLTAAITPEDMVAAFQSGANDFLHKPFTSSELKTRIRNLLLMKESAENITKMQVAFLQAQIKPHFVYNVLNSILSLSYIDIEKSRTLITDFAVFLRGSFSFENTKSLVPLGKELALVQSYVNIQSTRFPEMIKWEVCADEEINCMIPPLLIQPIVENAILHGLRNKKADGKLGLRIMEKDNMLHILVSDNGNGMSEEKIARVLASEKPLEQGIGLQNIEKRLKHYKGATLKITSIELEGTTVEIQFPVIHETKGAMTYA